MHDTYRSTLSAARSTVASAADCSRCCLARLPSTETQQSARDRHKNERWASSVRPTDCKLKHRGMIHPAQCAHSSGHARYVPLDDVRCALDGGICCRLLSLLFGAPAEHRNATERARQTQE